MYQALLTRRYLTRRIMPLLSALAVALSTAMVLTTWSVMGGFLQILLDSGKTFVGDVKITRSNRGVPLYDDLIADLEADDMVERACAIVETFGVLSLPGDDTRAVKVLGVEPESYDAVTGYYQTLYWRPIDRPVRKDEQERDPRLRPLVPENGALARELELTWEQILENGRTLLRLNRRSMERVPAMVPGIEVNNHINRRQVGGWYLPYAHVPEPRSVDDWHLMPVHGEITLRVLPLDDDGRSLDMASRVMPVANEFRTGNYEFDSNLVIVPRAMLQEMMHLDEAERLVAGQTSGIVVDPVTGEERFARPETIVEPARANAILVSARPGVSASALRERVQAIYRSFAERHAHAQPAWGEIWSDIQRRQRDPGNPPDPNVQTWEQINAGFIGAVRKEIALVLVLFTFISITAVFLVLAIFWSMVNEKTKDVGVLRSLGASRSGIAWLWLRYGLAIGVVGSILGGLLSLAIVRNINPIHEWLGSALGITVWDPKVYYFSEIPSKVDPGAMAMVLVGGVIAAGVGALVPSVRAAFMDPVRALRHE